MLFTVVSRHEKYSAKLVIDLVVQRAGDSVAAAGEPRLIRHCWQPRAPLLHLAALLPAVPIASWHSVNLHALIT